VRAWLQLLRLPNVFTAIADVLMGYLFTHELAKPTLNLPGEFWCLLAASSFLYTAGIVLNDVYDYEVDARDRPHRPIPSGRVQLRQARLLGYLILLGGVGLAALSAAMAGQSRAIVVAVVLAIAIVLYDWVLKKTPAAPLLMGSCRALNVLLGMSAAPEPWQPIHWLVAAGIGTYVAGVTWFARTEARQSNRGQLALGTAVMLAGVALLAWYPQWADTSVAEASQPDFVAPERWTIVWSVIGLLIGWRCVAAVLDPAPATVQYAVRNCIFSLIVLDGMVTFGVRGMAWAVVVLLLLVPTMFLGKWIYST
jgi:4-hydroxybenzoate polyprenyltransferase